MVGKVVYRFYDMFGAFVHAMLGNKSLSYYIGEKEAINGIRYIYQGNGVFTNEDFDTEPNHDFIQ